MLSKKHFKKFAALCSYTKPSKRSPARFQQWQSMQEEIASLLANMGQNFDKARFNQACYDPEYWKGKL